MRGLLCVLMLTATAATAEVIAVPSGQPIELIEKRIEPDNYDGLTWRLRFVAPQIARDGGGLSFDIAAIDMETLCAKFATSDAGTEAPRQIIISLSDRPTEYGAPAPDATQYFEAYAVENGTCIWKGF